MNSAAIAYRQNLIASIGRGVRLDSKTASELSHHPSQERLAAAVVALENVTVKFGTTDRLKSVHLAVGRGETLAVMGPSGSGKSLLLKVMVGLVSPTSGVVYVDGRDLSALSTREVVSRNSRIGMLFQRNALFDSMTALENVCFPQIETLGVSEKEAIEFSKELLSSVGLAAAAERYPAEMSGGMQKRLGIARALALRPEFLLFDDPTAGLDPITSRSIMRLIKELQVQTRATVVVVTNEVARAYQVADRMLLTFSGEAVDVGSPAEAREHRDPRVRQFLKGETEGPLQ